MHEIDVYIVVSNKTTTTEEHASVYIYSDNKVDPIYLMKYTLASYSSLTNHHSKFMHVDFALDK